MSDIESLRTSALASVEVAASTAELEELRVQLLMVALEEVELMYMASLPSMRGICCMLLLVNKGAMIIKISTMQALEAEGLLSGLPVTALSP